jgi:hypothetical protein
MPSLFALVELFNEPIPDVPGVGKPLLDLLRAGMDNEPSRRPSASRLREELQRLSPDTLGVATNSVFAPRSAADDATVNWAADTGPLERP